MNNINITISIDDVNPTKGYRILGEPTQKWLTQLNNEFGCKFTLFIPSNFHEVGKLSDNKSWIQELNSIPWLELAAHGHYHECVNSQVHGECEFNELVHTDAINKRIQLMRHEWETVEIIPRGFRPPGWLISLNSKRIIDGYYNYVAVHNEHSREHRWIFSKPYYGHDDIGNSDIEIHNDDMIMYQSHIAGIHNKNVWNTSNYEQLHLSLTSLLNGKVDDNFQFQFKTLYECHVQKQKTLDG